MNLLYLGNEILRNISKPVEHIDDELKAFINEMFITLKKENGIGLAAPQVGKNIRVFIVMIDTEKYVFINPQIIETSNELCKMEEGCLSIPKIYESVVRPSSVRIQFLDINGKRKTVLAEGLLARVIQHENDHLDGVLFIDRLAPEKKAGILKKIKK